MQTSIFKLQHHASRFVLFVFLFTFVFVTLALLSPGTLHAQESGITHVVKPGESLSSIAARYGTTVSALAQANGITNRNHLAIGQVLTIPVAPPPRATAEPQTTAAPAGRATPPPAATARPNPVGVTPAPAAPAPVTSEVVHTVYPGETLSSLAARYGTTVAAIRQRNGLRSNVLLVGQKLIIPAGRGGGVSAPAQPITRPAAGTPAATATREPASGPQLLPTVESSAQPEE